MKNTHFQNLKTTFLVHFIVAFIFGLAYLLLPATVANLFGIKSWDLMSTRLLGAVLVAIAVSSWLSFNATNWESVRIVLALEITFTVLGALVILVALLRDGYAALNWLNFIVLAGFAGTFCFFWTKKE